ncbi:hypothetical protein HI914_03434 [Erysiphe necator]|nr:hypothetical protein HI914_03434 [Erysiphe necator]
MEYGYLLEKLTLSHIIKTWVDTSSNSNQESEFEEHESSDIVRQRKSTHKSNHRACQIYQSDNKIDDQTGDTDYSYTRLKTSHSSKYSAYPAFVAHNKSATALIKNPSSFEEAVSRPEANKRYATIKDECIQLHGRNT